MFDFDASYQEDFIRYRSEQTGIETTDGVEFGTTPRTFVSPSFACCVYSELFTHSLLLQFPAMPPDYSIIGLSIFKCLEPSAFPVKFSKPCHFSWTQDFHTSNRRSSDFKASAGNSVTSTVSTLYSGTNCDLHLFLQDYGSIQRDVSINFDFKP